LQEDNPEYYNQGYEDEHFLLERNRYGARMTPEEIQNECNYLFNQNTAPVAFNGLESSELDVAIMKSLVD